jgi:RimJ/RimL family protein N-acetyltransferase
MREHDVMPADSASVTAARAAFEPERVALRDGSEIVIRQIEPADKLSLMHGFEALSPDSRYRRFLAPTPRLSKAQLAYLTEIDHHEHEALIAEAASGEEPVGVARFVRVEGEPTTAEVAVAVVDHWQGKGVASELLARLAQRARAEDIDRFRATCLAENRAALDVLAELGDEQRTNAGPGVVELDIELRADLGREHALRVALRRAASGALTFSNPVRKRRRRGCAA